MTDLHTLGLVRVTQGDILTLRINDPTAPGRDKHITILALQDIDFSRLCAEHYSKIKHQSKLLMTDQALPSLIEDLVERGLVKIPVIQTVTFGDLGKPASRLSHEYRYSLNPEQYWKPVLEKHYQTHSVNVLNHQGHTLTVVSCDDPHFLVRVSLVDSKGLGLGILTLDMVCESKSTLISDTDIEDIRLVLQSDITIALPDHIIMVDQVFIESNPARKVNMFKLHSHTS